MYRSQANSELSTLNADCRLCLDVYLDYQILLMVYTCTCICKIYLFLYFADSFFMMCYYSVLFKFYNLNFLGF